MRQYLQALKLFRQTGLQNRKSKPTDCTGTSLYTGVCDVASDTEAVAIGGRDAKTACGTVWHQKVGSLGNNHQNKKEQTGSACRLFLSACPWYSMMLVFHKSSADMQCRRRWKNFQDAELKKTGVWTPAVCFASLVT